MGFRIVVGLQAAMLVAGLAAAVLYPSAGLFWHSFGPSFVVALLFVTGAWILEAVERRKLAASPELLPVQSFAPGPGRVGVLTLWVGLIAWLATNSYWPAVVAYLAAMVLFLLWSFGLKGAEQKWLAEHYANR